MSVQTTSPGTVPAAIGRASGQRMRRLQVPALIWLGLVLAILLGAFGENIRYLNRFEWVADDLRMALFPPAVPLHPKVVVVAIDENTIWEAKARSPIDRAFLSRLLANLDAEKPAAIAIDLLFDRPTDPADDEALRQQLHRMTVPVMVADGNPRSDPNLINEKEAKFLDSYFATFDNPLVRQAHVRIPEDKDNIVRRVPEMAFPGSLGAVVPSISAGVVAATGWPMAPAEGRIAYYGYFGQPLDLQAEPFEKIPGRVFASGSPALLAFYKSHIAGKIVFVGSYLDDTDRHETPFTIRSGTTTPGVMIQAALAAQMIDARWIRIPTPIENGVISVIIVLAGFMVGVRSSNNWLTLAVVIGLMGLIWGGGVAAYVYPVDDGRGRSLYPIVTPIFALLGATALGYALTRRQFAAERNFIQGALATYVSASVAKQLLEDPSLLSVGGDRREISALFTDIEGFTTLSEDLDPATLVDILNRYLEGMTQIVLAHDGLLDKYIGDAVVALWNADVPRADHAAKAVDCAVELARFSGEFAAAERQRNIPFGRTRIGVQTGYAVVGNFGGARKLNFTAIGDTMNLTSRLEGANKYLGTSILIGAAAAERSGRADLRPIAELVVKGRDEAVSVFGPTPHWDPERLARYRRAYELLQSRDPKAEAALQELADKQDPIIHLYLERLAAGRLGTHIVLEEK